MATRFFYFAYGSNLLTSRIHVRNKSAEKVSIGRLKDHKLTFACYSNLWKGSSANIVPDAGSIVIGVVWSLDEQDLANLDAQEVNYTAKNVLIEVENSESITCRTYVMDPEFAVLIGPPSLAYKNILIKGAQEQNFPSEYIQYLQNIEDNGNLDATLAHLLKN